MTLAANATKRFRVHSVRNIFIERTTRDRKNDMDSKANKKESIGGVIDTFNEAPVLRPERSHVTTLEEKVSQRDCIVNQNEKEKKEMASNEMISIQEAAKRIGMRQETLRNLIIWKKTPFKAWHVKLPSGSHRFFIPRKPFEEWISEGTAATEERQENYFD